MKSLVKLEDFATNILFDTNDRPVGRSLRRLILLTILFMLFVDLWIIWS